MTRAVSSLIPLILSVAVLFLPTGCAPLQNRTQIDFAAFTDQEIPSADRPWLSPSPQALPTERITDEASTIHGRNRRERVYQVMDHVWGGAFKFDRWDNERMFARSADDLFRDRTLGGCADYALVLVAFFRALQIPARMVVTANVNWIAAYHNNPLSMPEGHVFVEAYLEDHWSLVDPTFRRLYNKYDQAETSLPGDQLYCQRGTDYWQMGIHKVTQLQQTMEECAARYQPSDYNAPSLLAEPL